MILSLIVKPVWLLMENLVQDKIGHESYGLFAGLFSLCFLFSAFSDLGINYYVTKKLAVEPDKIKEIFSNVFSIKLFLLVLYPLLMVGMGGGLGYGEIELYFLVILSFTLALTQLLQFFRANFQASQFFVIDSIASVFDKVFLILIVLALLYFGVTLESFIIGRLIAIAFTIILFYLITLKLYGWIKPKVELQLINGILKFSLPFAIVAVLYSINERVDQVMLLEMSGEKATGLYAGAYRWYDAFMMYIWTIMPIFFAKFSYNSNDDEEKQKIFNFGIVISVIPLFFVGGFLFFYAEKLFFLFDNSTLDEITVMSNTLKILFVAAILHGFFAILGTLLNTSGYEKVVSFYLAGSIILNVILNYIFIPYYGISAAAWATVVSTFFMGLSYILLIHKNLPQKIPYTILAKLIVVFIGFMLAFYLLTFTSLSWVVQTIIAGVVLLIISYFMNLIKWKNIAV